MAEAIGRRRAIGLAVGGGLFGGGLVLGRSLDSGPDRDSDAADTPAPSAPSAVDGSGAKAPAVDHHGPHQAGIDQPERPQPACLLTVLTVDASDTSEVAELLDALAETVAGLTGRDTPLPDGAGDLTVTVGIGPRLLALTSQPMPAAEGLPAFVGDEALDPALTGGDLVLNICSSDPGDLDTATRALIAVAPGATVSWRQRGFRGHGEGTVVRNPLGFHDGVIVPRGPDLARNVWVEDGPAEGGTVMVVRRLRLDPAFGALAVDAQEAVIGRRKTDGSPLSGGGLMDEADLLAKAPDGAYLVPARSHVRAAHPSFTGSDLMLRRGYAFDDGDAADGTADSGLLFVCFQRSLDTFVRTQHRLDETDDLMNYATVTATGVFLVPPGLGGGPWSQAWRG